MFKISRFTKAVAFFIFSMLGLSVMVFFYAFLSGGGEIGQKYANAYLPLAVFALVLAASFAGRGRRRDP
jgi:hypothetical protein